MEIWLIFATVVVVIVLFALYRRKADQNLFSTATLGSAADDTMAAMHLFPVSEFNPVPGSLNDLVSGNVTLNDCSAVDVATDSVVLTLVDCSAPAIDASSSTY